MSASEDKKFNEFRNNLVLEGLNPKKRLIKLKKKFPDRYKSNK